MTGTKMSILQTVTMLALVVLGSQGAAAQFDAASCINGRSFTAVILGVWPSPENGLKVQLAWDLSGVLCQQAKLTLSDRQGEVIDYVEMDTGDPESPVFLVQLAHGGLLEPSRGDGFVTSQTPTQAPLPEGALRTFSNTRDAKSQVGGVKLPDW